MGLDFSYTCPKIDKAISEAKDTIIDYLKDYITDLCPYITNEKASELSKDWGTDLYDKISDVFEAPRHFWWGYYNREKDKFFNEIIHDDSKFFDWLGFSEDGMCKLRYET